MPSVRDPAFFGGGPFCLRLGDENGFLLVTPPGPASYSVISDSETGFKGVGIGIMCVDKAFY